MSLILHGERLFKNLPHLNKNNAYLNWSQNTYADPNLKALPEGQRQLISLVLWKLLASSSRAIAGALGTMAERLQKLQNQDQAEDLASTLDEDYESLDETAEEWDEEIRPKQSDKEEQAAIAAEIEELRQFKELADTIQDDAKGKALLEALNIAFEKLEELGAKQKAIILLNLKERKNIYYRYYRKVAMLVKAAIILCYLMVPIVCQSAKNL